MGAPERDLKMAFTLIDTARAAGADAVKFQTYRPETVYVANAGESDYLAGNGIKESITDIFRDLAMPYEMIPKLADHCRQVGIEFMSTPFSIADAQAVDPHVKRHKIASYEINHSRLIEWLAKTGKPVIQSTGAATYDDIAWMIAHFHQHGGKSLTLLQCTAKYPAPLDAMNLRAIPELAARYQVSVGLSDHSRDPVIAPVAAVALGATVIEKHYTLDNRLPGPDHAFAITAEELKVMVGAVRAAETARGDGKKVILPAEAELRAFAQRGLQTIAPIKKGDKLAEGNNIDILRPGKQRKGLHPQHLPDVEGKRATRDIAPGDGLQTGDYA